MSEPTEGRKESVKTYQEQTKLLITLASAFLFAPAGLIGILKDRSSAGLSSHDLCTLIAVESCFILSVVSGYIVFGTLAGSLHLNEYNVYRPATMWSSRVQFLAYLIGLLLFIKLAINLLS
jgi:hypothetical protein